LHSRLKNVRKFVHWSFSIGTPLKKPSSCCKFFTSGIQCDASDTASPAAFPSPNDQLSQQCLHWIFLCVVCRLSLVEMRSGGADGSRPTRVLAERANADADAVAIATAAHSTFAGTEWAAVRFCAIVIRWRNQAKSDSAPTEF
jgi:hypothetical protein